MAGNKKKPRKPGKSRVRTFTTQGTLPIIFRNDAEVERTLKVMPHLDLAEIREGRGNADHYWTVVNRLNWCSTLASMVDFSFDPSPVLNAGQDAMLALYLRAKETGKYVFKGEELKAVGEALTLADDMHDATTRRQHRDALVKLMAQYPEDKEAA